ncbi:MAG: hypothetical protein AAF456_24905, partial [Planctomycetota bacterium]
IDSEGHYTERSTSIYSPIVNKCLITAARLLDKTELLEPVRLNLDMTPFLLHSNDEIVTEVSRRQDQFRIARTGNHYLPFRYMAIHDENGSYASMVKFIEESTGTDGLYGNLPYFMENDMLLSPLPEQVELPDRYTRIFEQSKVVRCRNGKTDSTIIADNSTFVTLFHGNAALRAIRMAAAFFGKGQFESSSIDRRDRRTFSLRRNLKGPYYQPLPPAMLPGDGDWHKMPRERRTQSNIKELETSVSVAINDAGLELTVDINGTDNVPFAIELAFGHSGELSGVLPVEGVEGAFLPEDSGFEFESSGDRIVVRGCRANHRWTQIRGAQPKLDAQCVYITDFSPCRIQLKFTTGS